MFAGSKNAHPSMNTINEDRRLSAGKYQPLGRSISIENVFPMLNRFAKEKSLFTKKIPKAFLSNTKFPQ